MPSAWHTAPLPTPDDIAAERARRSLGAYGAHAHGHAPARHHQVWIARITDLIAGRTAKRKLLVVAPPGHAKSTWLSLIFPPWYLGTHPDHSLLFFTSADTLAGQYGGTVKLTLESNERHIAAFRAGACRPDLGRGWSSDGLYLVGTPAGSKDPAYRALGYGAAVVGARAHGIILDDPLTQEQAQSAVEQARARRYHDMTVDSRLHPDGWELAIMTRWHDADLAAHLAGRADWDVLAMPALGYWDDDAPLWPERFSRAWLEAKRAEIGGATFNCLYQADPTGLGGSVFKEAAWFRPLPDDFAHGRVTILQYWDLAFSAKETADYTVCLTLGVDRARNLYILSVVRRRLTPDQVVEAMVEQIMLWRPLAVGVEETAFRQAVTADILRRVLARAFGAVTTLKPTTDKVARARLPAAYGEAGKLFADRDAPWFPPFEGECLAFPLGAHDDQVDALAGACQIAIEKLPARQELDVVPFPGWKPIGAAKPRVDWFNGAGLSPTPPGRGFWR